MKNLKFSFLLIFFPLFGFAQSLNGIYTGVLSNDSTTIRKDQSFEMALTEYKGKVYGYAYSTFIVNDTLYYIVKRVKGKVEGDICEVEDDDVISHNFPQKPEKKVFVTYTLRRNALDSVWKLDGNWKTNLTKKYYAISGKVEAKEEKDLSKSKLYEHLGDLDLQKTLAFANKKETVPEKKTVAPKEDKNALAKNNVKKEDKKTTSASDTKSFDKKPDASIAKTEAKLPENKTASTNTNNQPLQNDKKDALATNTNTVDKKVEPPVIKSENKLPENKTASITNPPIQNEKKDVPASNTNDANKKPENNIAKTETKLPDNKAVSTQANNPPVQNVKKDLAVTTPNTVDKKPDASTVKTDTKLPDNNPANQPVKNNSVAANTNTIDKKPEPVTTKQENKLVSVPVTYKTTQNATNTNPTDKKTESNVAKTDNKIVATNNQQNQNDKKDIAASEKKTGADFEFKELTKTNRNLKPAAALVDGRETKPSETIFFKSDSLSIALYDNGEVDGDTVSVIINDELFIEKQGLKSSAFRKTFYIPKGEGDSLLVVLFADNLGKYPPNTGLLQIKDGEEIFYVRFKADLDRNAAIVLRRRSK